MRGEYHPLVAEDLLEAATYYEHQQSGLGFAFLDEVDSGIQIIKDNPTAWSVVFGTIRKFRLKRFKAYSIRYRFCEEFDKIRF